MRDINRIDRFCDILKKCWKQVPDWRFGQLICNVQRRRNSDCFYIEDDTMLEFIMAMFGIKEENKEDIERGCPFDEDIWS